MRNTLIVVASNVPKATDKVGSTTPFTVGRSNCTANKFPSTGCAAFWPLKKMAIASAIAGHSAKARTGGNTNETNCALYRGQLAPPHHALLCRMIPTAPLSAVTAFGAELQSALRSVGLKLTLTTTLGIDDGIIVGRKLMLGAKLDATDRTTIALSNTHLTLPTKA